MTPSNLLILLLAVWILVRAYWFALDPRPFQEIVAWGLKPKNIVISLFDLIGAIILFVSVRYFPLPTTPFDKYIIAVGLSLYIIGVIVAIWARSTMKNNWTPAGTGHNINRQDKLLTKGPFKYTRNPIYLGLIFMTIGLFISLRSYFLPLAFIQIIFFYKSILKEEKLLEKYFGQEYLKYKSKVPRLI